MGQQFPLEHAAGLDKQAPANRLVGYAFVRHQDFLAPANLQFAAGTICAAKILIACQLA
jgi:hypothetical protein